MCKIEIIFVDFSDMQSQPMIQLHQFRPFLMILKLALKFLNDSKILHFFGIMSVIHQSENLKNGKNMN